MVTADEVLLVIVSDSVLLVPTGTDPKFRLLFPSPIVSPLFEPADRPWHPVSSNRPPATAKKMAKRRYNRITFFCDRCMPFTQATAAPASTSRRVRDVRCLQCIQVECAQRGYDRVPGGS